MPSRQLQPRVPSGALAVVIASDNRLEQLCRTLPKPLSLAEALAGAPWVARSRRAAPGPSSS